LPVLTSQKTTLERKTFRQIYAGLLISFYTGSTFHPVTDKAPVDKYAHVNLLVKYFGIIPIALFALLAVFKKLNGKWQLHRMSSTTLT
jgi:hypothetical protein